MTKIYSIALCIFFILSQVAYAGGPWASGKGRGYSQLGISLNTYDKLLSSSSRLDRTVTDNTLQLYAEYGLTDKWTLTGVLPYKFLSTGKSLLDPNTPQVTLPSGNLAGFGNISLAAKYTFYQKGIHFAGQLLTEAPNYSINNEAGLRTGYNSFVVCPSLLLGTGTKRFYGFANLGYALRSGGYSEEIRSDLELGFSPFKRFWTALAFNNKNSLKNGNVVEGNIAKTALYINNQSYNAWGVKLSYGFNESFGLNVSVYGAFSGQNVAAAPTFNSSIYYKW
ncbi:MAG: hypothetical protein K1X92_03190 [Bacteroidia bacterium]|nr:hypothetical protein [Bacteroidia bacterium]